MPSRLTEENGFFCKYAFDVQVVFIEKRQDNGAKLDLERRRFAQITGAGMAHKLI